MSKEKEEKEKKYPKCGSTSLIPYLKIGKAISMCEGCDILLDKEDENI